VKAKALRDAAGAVAWQARGDQRETAVIAVGLQEVARWPARVKAQALRDAAGAVMWQASGDQRETAVIAVALQEVAR